jgi:glycosyltransferase involved in cell wall biosynthesis
MASLLIYPSLYEGFGIPILEAMKMGLPIITSNRSAMPEVAQEAACLVDPESTSAMTTAMAKMLEDKDLREELKLKGLAHARKFTWEMVAERYLKLYQEINPK